MSYDFAHLAQVLSIAKALADHPNYSALRKIVNDELKELEAGAEKDAEPLAEEELEQGDLLTPKVFAAGTNETDTGFVTPPADRRV